MPLRDTNHEMKAFQGNSKLENVMLGQGAKINQMAFNQISKYFN